MYYPLVAKPLTPSACSPFMYLFAIFMHTTLSHCVGLSWDQFSSSTSVTLMMSLLMKVFCIESVIGSQIRNTFPCFNIIL